MPRNSVDESQRLTNIHVFGCSVALRPNVTFIRGGNLSHWRVISSYQGYRLNSGDERTVSVILTQEQSPGSVVPCFIHGMSVNAGLGSDVDMIQESPRGSLCVVKANGKFTRYTRHLLL